VSVEFEDVVTALRKAIIEAAEERKRLEALPEFQEQRRLVLNWMGLATFETFQRKHGSLTCPLCDKSLASFSCCGQSLEQMVERASNKITQHGQVVKLARAATGEQGNKGRVGRA